jgi:hypothetical protein
MREAVKTWRRNNLQIELEYEAGEIAALCSGWAQNIERLLYNHEEALMANLAVVQWIQFSQIVSLGCNPSILEADQNFPKSPSLRDCTVAA